MNIRDICSFFQKIQNFHFKISQIVAVWPKIMAIFQWNFCGGFWRVLDPKVAVSDFKQLTTLFLVQFHEFQIQDIEGIIFFFTWTWESSFR